MPERYFAWSIFALLCDVDFSDFSWSPTDNLISYWTPEERDTPARVVVVRIPSRETFCQKNLFTVKDCRLHWQKNGDYLCVKVDRYKGKKEEKDTVKYSVSPSSARRCFIGSVSAMHCRYCCRVFFTTLTSSEFAKKSVRSTSLSSKVCSC